MASDTFTATNNPLAAPWTNAFGNNLKSTGGEAVVVTASSDSCMRYSGAAMRSECTIGTVGDRDGGPALISSSGNGYISTNYDAGLIHIFLVNSGAIGSELGTGSAVAYAANDVITMRRSGGNVIVDVNGSPNVTVADSTYTTSLEGAVFLFGTVGITAWSDGAAGGAAAASTLMLMGIGP